MAASLNLDIYNELIDRGITQKAIADFVGITPRAIRYWLEAGHIPKDRIKALEALSQTKIRNKVFDRKITYRRRRGGESYELPRFTFYENGERRPRDIKRFKALLAKIGEKFFEEENTRARLAVELYSTTNEGIVVILYKNTSIAPYHITIKALMLELDMIMSQSPFDELSGLRLSVWRYKF